MRETASALSPRQAATVLAFPAERARPPSPQTRLARALESLRDALAEQHQAARALQDASAQLRTTLAELQRRLEGHRAGLNRLAGDVAQVNTQARTLESWADSAIATDRRHT